MKKVLKIILPIAVIGAGFGVKSLLLSTVPEEYALRVETLTPIAESHTLSISAYGEVQPNHLLTTTAQVRGVVLRLGDNMQVGAFVNKGDLLFELDRTDYELALTAAQADLRKADANLQLEQAQAEMALQDWAQVGQGDAPALAKHEPQLAAASAGVDAANAKIALIQRDLARCTLTAPMNARIQERRVAPGQWVAPGTPLAVLLGTEKAQVVVPIPLADLAYLPLDVKGASGLPVALRTQIAGKDCSWQGLLTRTKAGLNPSSRTLQAIVTVVDPYGLLLPSDSLSQKNALVPGMFVHATFQGNDQDNVIRLPRRVLMSDNRIPTVDAENRLRALKVEVLQLTQKEVILKGGALDKTRVCITPLATFIEGMKVVPTEAKR